MTNDTASATETVPNTDYFEIESPTIGATFAVWVTRPLAYEALPEATFPVVYVTDGNIATAVTAPYAVLYGADLVTPMQPYLQVSIGYAGMGIMEANIVRNRDLVPPGEPVPAHLSDTFDQAVAGGAMSQEQFEQIMTVLRNPHAEDFLAFLETDLHQAVSDRYRVSPGRQALFGYSYGGLFSLYALLRQSPLFDRIGAGSPGIFGESRVFDLLEQLSARGASFDDVSLFLTVNQLELSGDAPLYRQLGRSTVAFEEALRAAAFDGLDVSSRVIEDESHVSGLTASYLAFIRSILVAAS